MVRLSLFLFCLILHTFGAVGQETQLIVRQGHKEAVTMVKYSPDGQSVYSASEDKSIKQWDVKTGIDINTFNAHQAGVNCIELSKDGTYLISGDQAGKVIIWNAKNGELIKTIDAHQGGVNVVKLTKDGQTIVTGGEDKLMKVWTITGDTIKTIRGFKSAIKNFGISPDAKRIVSGGGKSNGVEVLLIDLEKGKIIDDALNHIKGSGAALVYTKVLLTGFAVVGNIAKGNVGKGMTTIFVMTYSNIEFTNDGSKILLSQNLFVPFIAGKGEEEDTGSSSISIVELSADRNQFGEVSKPIRWPIANPRAVAVFNQDQTKVITNDKNAIKIFDIENADFPEPGNKEATLYVPPVIKEIQNISKNTNWIELSPDYQTIVSSDESRNIKLWDYASGRKIRNLEGYVQPVLAVDVMPDGKHLLVGSQDRNMTLWNLTTGQLVRTFDRSSDINHIDISADGKYILTTAINTDFCKLWNFKTGRLLRSFLDKKHVIWSKFSKENDDHILTATEDGTLKIWSIKENKVKKKPKVDYKTLEDKYRREDYAVSFEGYSLTVTKAGSEYLTAAQKGIITDAVFSLDTKYLITTNESGVISLYDLATKKRSVSMALIGENDFITYTTDLYYTSSKAAAKAIAFKSENQVLPFEQLELKYNRPDIIVKRLGYASQKLVDSYKAAYDRRLKRLGFSASDFGNTFDFPTLSIDYSQIPLATEDATLSFKIKAKDQSSKLDRLQIYANGVPVFGSKGIDVSGLFTSELEREVSFKLAAGSNEIKVTAINSNGLESIPQTFEIMYNRDYFKPNLYLVSIGVSDYRQSAYNLAFAAKDAQDIVTTLTGSSAYENIYSKIIVNADATNDNIKSIRSFVEQAGVDDVVMIFIAGHGVLDSNYTYYFATYNIDFSNPANGGLPYEALENIIDGIDCRNKILLMDTCHSGELDDSDVEDAVADTKKPGSVAFRSTGTIIKLKENTFGLQNTLELSKSLFGDMKKGTGATVISAAGGTEFAAEGVNSKNGLFTASFIEGIKTRRADWNRDRRYTVSEMRNFVSTQVIKKSGGKQVPTSREENLQNDFRIY